jgi:hypothetical protein
MLTMKIAKNDIRPTVQLELQEWPTMEQDISKAHDVIMRHNTSEEGPLSVYLQEATIWLEGSVEVTRASWVVELAEVFELQYGKKKGNEILCRVLTALLTNGETIH